MSSAEFHTEADFLLTGAGAFELESGASLSHASLRYCVYGSPAMDGSNVILVPHALSGSARVMDWWPQLFGRDAVFDISRDCIIGINLIGSCYGSTGPSDVNPATGRAYGRDFPIVTVRDNVRAQSLLMDYLGLEKLRAVVGGSIGGMQALQWAIDFPDRLGTCIAIGSAPLGAMGLALNHLQRRAINDNPEDGLSLARQIAMCSYKSAELFEERFGRKPNRNGERPDSDIDARYDVAGYLDYQGRLFVNRFNPDSYLIITKLMDTFEIARGYRDQLQALSRIKARVLLVGIESDWLFPTSDIRKLQADMVAAGVRAEYRELESSHGHDGFLAEADRLSALLRSFLDIGKPITS